MRFALFLMGLVVAGCATGGDTVGGPRSEVLRDAEGYAIASCLTYQAPAYLKDQGDAWASVIVQRWKGSLDALLAIAEQVKRENARGDMAVIRDESGQGKDKALPVLYCSEMIDKPSVRAAIQKAVADARSIEVQKSTSSEFEVNRQAAERGNARAQNALGILYVNGRGVPQDDAQAVKWFRRAAEQGLAQGQVNLGNMYADGKGIARDERQAVEWYRKAAEQGDALAQSNLGFMFGNGRGVPKDDVQAAMWYRKAAEQGHASAQFDLAVRYANGIGVPKDDAQAAKWYKKAAEGGGTPWRGGQRTED